MKRYLRWIGLCVVVFIVGQGAVKVLGAQTVSGLDDFSEIRLSSGARQACWRGICPGQITMDDAAALMNRMPLLHLMDDFNKPNNYACWANNPQSTMICLQGESTVKSIAIRDFTYKYDAAGNPLTLEPRFAFGDLMLRWGTPTRMSSPFCGTSGVWFDNGVQTGIEWVPYISEGLRLGWELGPANKQFQSINIGEQPATKIEDWSMPWIGFIGARFQILCGK